MTDLLNPDALHKGLNELPGWSGNTDDGITKTFTFASSDEARAFLDRVALISDDMDHHADSAVDGGTVRLTIVTHSAGGVTQNDLDLATRIETGEAHGDANRDNPAAGQVS